ncbi:MAG TPA: PQQ-binding-like beta-propeller repeat protein [Gammaproteobacteria bacterium]|jgi:polyvinyl alcohol dehydrogenase (cytochrome)|nr:PQQ-binding-like beta-propeller repeat protein [Gammaproteobacteria bacterium]
MRRGWWAVLIGAQLGAAWAFAQPAGEAIFAARCAGCHDAPPSDENRAPPKSVLQQMSVARIVRTMDFGAMMSLTYMLNRAERQAVAEYLGVAGEDRAPPAAALCSDRTVGVPRGMAGTWNGWSPAPTNTRYQPKPGFTSEQVPRLRLLWAFGFAGDVNAFAAPAVLGQQLFVGSAGGSIYALDARTGCIRWHFQADGPVRTSMVVAARDVRRYAVLFGDQAGNFYAVAAENGALLWRQRPEAHESTKLTGTPLAHDGVVYVPVASWEESRPLNPGYECCTFRGSVVAYRIADGAQLWKSWLVTEEPKPDGTTPSGARRWAPSGVGTWSAPTLDADRGLLYVTTGNSYTGQVALSDAVVALRLADGGVEWSQQVTPGDEFNLGCNRGSGCPGMDYDIGASAVLEKLADGRERLLVGQKSGVVYGLDPARRGEVVWQARVGKGGINGGVLWGLASDGRNVYAAVSDLARRARTDGVPFDWRPNGVDPDKGGGLTALAVGDGARAWYAPPAKCPPAQAVCSPAQPSAVTAIPGAVFSGAVDGHLRAFSARDGSLLWDFDTAREFATVNGVPARGGSIDGAGPVVAGGRVYATSGYARNGGMPGNVLLAFGVR